MNRVKSYHSKLNTKDQFYVTVNDEMELVLKILRRANEGIPIIKIADSLRTT